MIFPEAAHRLSIPDFLLILRTVTPSTMSRACYREALKTEI